MGLSLITRTGTPSRVASGRSLIRPERGLLGAAEQALVRIAEVAHEQVAAVVKQQVRPRGYHLPEVLVVHGLVGGRPADNLDAAGAQVGNRLGLGARQVAGGDHPRAAARQG